MNYGTVIGDVITAPLSMRSVFNGIGGWHALSDAERAEHGWYPADVVNESYDPRSQVRSTEPAYKFDGERITATYTVTEKSLDVMQNEALDELAAIRFKFEVGGVVNPDGIKQPTTRTERLLLSDKLSFMRSNPSVETTSWKASGERHKLTTTQLGELQTLVGLHVDKCYLAEDVVAKQVEAAETIDELLAINLTSAFSDAFNAIE